MFKTVRMTAKEAFEACNVSLPTVLDNEPLSVETLIKSIETYKNAEEQHVLKLKNKMEAKGKEFNKPKDWKLVLFLKPTDMNNLITDSNFVQWFDPVTKAEVLETGFLGSVMGIDMYGDKPDEPTYQIHKTELRAYRELTAKEQLSKLLEQMEEADNDSIGTLVTTKPKQKYE